MSPEPRARPPLTQSTPWALVAARAGGRGERCPAAALPSYLLRLSPLSLFHSVPDQLLRVCTQRQLARHLCVQLPGLNALMLIVWKRVAVGFVPSFLLPESSCACKD